MRTRSPETRMRMLLVGMGAFMPEGLIVSVVSKVADPELLGFDQVLARTERYICYPFSVPL